MFTNKGEGSILVFEGMLTMGSIPSTKEKESVLVKPRSSRPT
jgi:hypothetical protein